MWRRVIHLDPLFFCRFFVRLTTRVEKIKIRKSFVSGNDRQKVRLKNQQLSHQDEINVIDNPPVQTMVNKVTPTHVFILSN